MDSERQGLEKPTLESEELRAPIAVLSPAQSKALLACLKAGILYRSRGAWIGEGNVTDQRISGITVADLAREGMLQIEIIGKYKSARLTPRGSWFARTAMSMARLP